MRAADRRYGRQYYLTLLERDIASKFRCPSIAGVHHRRRPPTRLLPTSENPKTTTSTFYPPQLSKSIAQSVRPGRRAQQKHSASDASVVKNEGSRCSLGSRSSLAGVHRRQPQPSSFPSVLKLCYNRRERQEYIDIFETLVGQLGRELEMGRESRRYALSVADIPILHRYAFQPRTGSGRRRHHISAQIGRAHV